MPKPLTVWITTNYGKFFKRWEHQTTLPASWEICMQVKKQQLELDMEKQTGSKSWKEYVKAAYGLSLVGANSSLLCAGFSCNGFSCCGAQTLGVQASVAAVHGLSNHDSQARESCLSSCGTRAQLLHSMWDLPGVGVKLMSPALAGRFKTTRPPGKSLCTHF